MLQELLRNRRATSEQIDNTEIIPLIIAMKITLCFFSSTDAITEQKAKRILNSTYSRVTDERNVLVNSRCWSFQ